MHNNYYFLRHLAPALEKRIKAFTLVSCFSQNKDELIIELNNTSQSFFVKASLLPELQCLSFPTAFHRARKNSIDLFPEIILKKVKAVQSFTNERSIGLILNDGYTLVFKMHGRRANVLLFEAQRVKAVFRNNLSGDLSVTLDKMDRHIDWSLQAFAQHQGDLTSYFFTLGKSVWDYLDSRDFSASDVSRRWKLFQEVVHRLESGEFALRNTDAGGMLTLLPDQSDSRFSNPLDAANEFFHHHVNEASLVKAKTSLLSTVRAKLKQTGVFLEKTTRRLAEVEADTDYQLWGDLLMAHLHALKPGMESVTLSAFENPDNRISIKLKKDLSPQKNAAAFYRKAKNRTIELRMLQETKARKEQELAALSQLEQEIQLANDRDSLQTLSRPFATEAKQKESQQTNPYHAHEWNGFAIWVGKNAKANDELTFHYGFKEDLWLHAKDVAGSHVLIKHQAGKQFPKDVIEFAAGLAAYHSKRKNEKLCPVTVTPKKFVRKRKGDAAGVVAVEREKVILVEPKQGY